MLLSSSERKNFNCLWSSSDIDQAKGSGEDAKPEARTSKSQKHLLFFNSMQQVYYVKEDYQQKKNTKTQKNENEKKKTLQARNPRKYLIGLPKFSKPIIASDVENASSHF